MIIIKSCFDGYYLSPTGTGTCTVCTGNCNKCSDASTCIICKVPYILNLAGTTCVLQCTTA